MDVRNNLPATFSSCKALTFSIVSTWTNTTDPMFARRGAVRILKASLTPAVYRVTNGKSIAKMADPKLRATVHTRIAKEVRA